MRTISVTVTDEVVHALLLRARALLLARPEYIRAVLTTVSGQASGLNQAQLAPRPPVPPVAPDAGSTNPDHEGDGGDA